MKMISYCTGWVTQNCFISDNAVADAAYATLKEALESYERFSNKKTECVTIDTGAGSATIKLENLVSVTLEDCSAAESSIIEREVWDRTVKAKIAAASAPGQPAA